MKNVIKNSMSTCVMCFCFLQIVQVRMAYSVSHISIHTKFNMCNGVFTPEQDNDKTTTRQMLNPCISMMPGVKGIIGMHRFNICLVVVLSLSCFGVKTPLGLACLPSMGRE